MTEDEKVLRSARLVQARRSSFDGRDSSILVMTNVEYIPYHICSSKTVTHRIYRDADRPSHLLLPLLAN